ncbi:MAG: phosphate ABC transporter ATP-binding protein PstB [Helicobacteraceae bacterium]|jgi:phosphate transport system ATP-binding protein|nr:phosphate ABC transporter ATP-binding protein PstB [Helicobacteraceae bacterium]
MSSIIDVAERKAIDVRNLTFTYSGAESPSLKNVDMPIAERKITALIGPSGCGKTTLLRCFNRIHDIYGGNRYEGKILVGDEDILQPKTDLIALRTRVGMIFQKPTAFPMSIFDNVAYGLRLSGLRSRAELANRVENALRGAALWNEVKDRLKNDANRLSGGQQQRLCIARAIALKPQVLLLDEPTSALDPISTQAIEQLLSELKNEISIAIVTHNMQQAARLSDYCAFMYLGNLVELSPTEQMFVRPIEKLTEEYITGRFG